MLSSKFLPYLLANTWANREWMTETELINKLAWMETMDPVMVQGVFHLYFPLERDVRIPCPRCQWEEINPNCIYCTGQWEQQEWEQDNDLTLRRCCSCHELYHDAEMMGNICSYCHEDLDPLRQFRCSVCGHSPCLQGCEHG